MGYRLAGLKGVLLATKVSGFSRRKNGEMENPFLRKVSSVYIFISKVPAFFGGTYHD